MECGLRFARGCPLNAERPPTRARMRVRVFGTLTTRLHEVILQDNRFQNLFK